MREGITAVPTLVERLYAIVGELEGHFPSRKFTPDGHLVGSIGEVLAAYHYGLDLYRASALAHDACCPEGREVQIKATQGRTVRLRCEPEHLLVLKLDRAGGFEEVFNGPGAPVWAAAGKMQESNGQRPISTSKLAALMEEVPAHARLRDCLVEARSSPPPGQEGLGVVDPGLSRHSGSTPSPFGDSPCPGGELLRTVTKQSLKRAV